MCLVLLCGCPKKKGGATADASATPAGTVDAGPSATGTSTTGTSAAGTSTAGQAPPASVPEFLDRFCAAVTKGDKAYVLAHTDNATFSSEQATDPKKCGGQTGKRCKRRIGGAHAAADFGPVCGRIQGTPRADLVKSVHEEGGALRVRLMDGDFVSDLVVERQGADFRLLREEQPGKR